MTTNLEVTGVLTNWRLSENRVHANVVRDYSGRFIVGEYITTSPVHCIELVKLDNAALRLLRTKNSTYILL